MSEFPNNNYRKPYKVKRISLLNTKKITKKNTENTRPIIESKKIIGNQRKLIIVVEKPVFVNKKIEILANPEIINKSIVNVKIKKIYKHSENIELKNKIRNNEERLKLLSKINKNLLLNIKKLEKQKNYKIVVEKIIKKKEIVEKGTQLFIDEERKIKLMKNKIKDLELIINQKNEEAENLKRELKQKDFFKNNSEKKKMINNKIKETNNNLNFKIEEKKRRLENLKKKNRAKLIKRTDKETLNLNFLNQQIKNIKNEIEKLSSEKQNQKKFNEEKEKMEKEKNILIKKLMILKAKNEELINKIENQNQEENNDNNRNNFLIIEDETNHINEKGSIKSLDTNINDDFNDNNESNVRNENYEKLIKNNILIMEEKLEISIKKLEVLKIMNKKLLKNSAHTSFRLICVLSELERLNHINPEE